MIYQVIVLNEHGKRDTSFTEVYVEVPYTGPRYFELESIKEIIAKAREAWWVHDPKSFRNKKYLLTIMGNSIIEG